MRSKFAATSMLIAALSVSPQAFSAVPTYNIEQAVALAQTQNPDIAIARKKVIGARGGLIEARSGFLPSLPQLGSTTNGSNRANRNSARKITTRRYGSNRIFILADR